LPQEEEVSEPYDRSELPIEVSPAAQKYICEHGGRVFIWLEPAGWDYMVEKVSTIAPPAGWASEAERDALVTYLADRAVQAAEALEARFPDQGGTS
jgi:hypothetical protein